MLPGSDPDSKLMTDVQSLINETNVHAKITVWSTIDANRDVHIWMRCEEGDAHSVSVKSVWDAKTFLRVLVRLAEQFWPTKVQQPDGVAD